MTVQNLGRVALVCGMLIVASLEQAAASGVESNEKAPGVRVEFDCKITPAPGEHIHRVWRVELRRNRKGATRQAAKGTGETARFRDLDPDIYRACIIGEGGSEHCQSFDLVPPEGGKSLTYSVSMEAPPARLNRSNANLIHVKQLVTPKAAQKELVKAELAEQRGDRKQMLQHLESALKIFPDYPEGLNNMGVYYHYERDFENAARYLSKATEADPNSYIAWQNLSSSLLAGGHFRLALEASTRALSLRSNDAQANTQLALSYYYLHDYDRAKIYFVKAQELDPAAASGPQIFLAQIAVVQDHDSEAEGFIRGFLAQHPNSPQAAGLKQMLAAIDRRLRSSRPADERAIGR